jgi:hypothetical protein
MVKTAVALLRKIWREICRQIFRESGTLTLPVPAHPRGQLSGAVPGMFVSPPEPQRALLEELTENVVSRLPDMDCRERGARVICKATGPYIGDLPASADQHHSEAYGLLRHSLEVALKMLEEFDKDAFSPTCLQTRPLSRFRPNLGNCSTCASTQIHELAAWSRAANQPIT